MSHKQMVHNPSPTNFSRFNNGSPRKNWIPRNKRTIIKQDVGNQMDNDIPWSKKSKFDHIDKKQPILENYQNVSDYFKSYIQFTFYYFLIIYFTSQGLSIERKNYDTLMEPVEAGNDEEMSNVRGTNSPNASNFESFPQEFGK